MAPKRLKVGHKQPDIRAFTVPRKSVPGTSCNTPGKQPEPQTPTCTPLRVKNEDGGDYVVSRLHHFTVKLSPSDQKEYYIDCDQPRTVLEAIKSTLSTHEKMPTCADENIIIQMGKEDRESILATHFPCTCVPDGESLIISCKSEKVEVLEERDAEVHPQDKYSVFYIDTVGGLNTKTKDLFRSKISKQYKKLCVYGVKGITVKEALTRDGRFMSLGEFELSDNENPNLLTLCTQKVDNLHQKTFKICLPLNKRQGIEKSTRSMSEVMSQSGKSVKRAMQERGSIDIEEIHELLRQQFPDLKRLMECKFPEGSYQKQLNLRKENFGKIQQAFSEVHRIKTLLEMGKSVCKVIVENVRQGTGFVLFDNFILTNAHLFKGCMKGNELKGHIKVHALFNYEKPEPDISYFHFIVKSLINFDTELDYAVLELEPEGQKLNKQKNTKNIKVPPGLLGKLGPKPENGEACIIGHPAGGVKKIDSTCIIEPEKRVQAVNDHLARYLDTMMVVQIINQIKDQGIEEIFMGGDKEDVSTYHTYMYHGASGSPVFDAHGQLFGLHTAGFYYEFVEKNSVIEYAQPILAIFEKFVLDLKTSGNIQILDRVKELVTDNEKLKEILEVEPMEEE
ncbi:serine protease FAM111A [Nothobranchius furzeri]|uniref:Protein FAM111A-like n=2 Tax=Nothobranchius furzeri TaxID=105023 RepID=A0A8C6PKN7_NOTFU|nr:protein FAM111A-like [Nothobranchius furzeri]